MSCQRLILIAVLPLVLCAAAASAQWTPDGVQLTSQQIYSFWGKVVPDGTGGAFVFYADNLSSVADSDLYAVRVDGHGQVVWPTPIVIAEETGHDIVEAYCEDGAGGAYICLVSPYGNPPSELYLQHVAADGAKRFAGLGINLTTNSQEYASMVPDGAGGVLVFWDEIGVTDSDIKGQRISADGTLQWAAGGVTICVEGHDQLLTDATAVPGGDAVVTWVDNRNEPTTGDDIYAQRVASDGGLRWLAAGLPVCTELLSQSYPVVAANPLGGVVIAWQDRRTGGQMDIYAQYLASDGSENWTAGGLGVATASYQQSVPRVACYDNGSTAVAWIDYYDVGEQGVAAQYISTIGSMFFPQPSGWRIAPGPSAGWVNLVSDGIGGVVMVWSDRSSGQYEAWGQRFDGPNMQWGTQPLLISTGSPQGNQPSAVSDGMGGVLVTFQQYTPNEGWAQRIGPKGDWGLPTGAITAIEDVPEDEGGWVRIRCTPSRLEDGSGGLGIFGYNVWRLAPDGTKGGVAAPTHADLASGAFDGRYVAAEAAKALQLPDGTWESVGYHAAVGLPEYLMLAPTRTDSTSAGAARETFCVTTHTDLAGVVYASLPDSGSSVDNLAPDPPKGLGGSADWDAGGVSLQWDGGKSADDVAGYNVYRGEVTGFPLDPAHLVGTTTNTWYFDAEPPTGSPHYKVTAFDRHGNESVAAVLSPSEISGVETPRTYRNRLSQNRPNPFNPVTTIVYELEKTGAVWLRVYDLSGQLVRTLMAGAVVERGGGEAAWRGEDDTGRSVAAGVYVYRLETPEFTATRRMVLIR